MGGGHVSRPDFGMPQPDPACPLTEFYLLLQHAMDAAGSFALPALYARVQAPARHIYLDEAREYLSLSPTGREGDIRLLAEGKTNRVVCVQGDTYVDYDITEALKMKKGLDEQTYTVMRTLTGVE